MFGFRKGAPPAEPEKKAAPARIDDEDDDFFGKEKTQTLKKKAKGKADLDNMSNQQLEDYAVDQAEETTKSVNNCLKIAEGIREDAHKTLDTLNAQGEQIHRTHEKAAEMEKDLSRGEKILGSLGGMFSATWKPKKGKEITGPEAINRKEGKKATKEEREKLGLDKKGKKANKGGSGQPKDAMQKVDMEKEKQDDALDELSDILGDLKGMAGDMGTELDRQNKALDNFSEDVDELNNRVKGANNRARKLVQK